VLRMLGEHGREVDVERHVVADEDPYAAQFRADAKASRRMARPPINRWRSKEHHYDAFLNEDLAMPRHLLRPVHNLYFDPQYPEFAPRTLWSLTNAFTSALKELDPVPQFKATAKLGNFFASLN
jgi:hypothetical protein